MKVAIVGAGFTPAETRRALKRKDEPSYMGTFTSARRYVLQTFATTESASMKKRAARYLVSAECPSCHGKRLKPDALAVKVAGLDIADLSQLTLAALQDALRAHADSAQRGSAGTAHPERAIVARRIVDDLVSRIDVLIDLGLGYLALDRSTPTLSPGELQRLRLATQVHSHLFGVVYVLDEPSAGLHPADTEALLLEHDLDVIRHADWIVDVGPGAGVHGGAVLYSGPPEGLQQVEASCTRRFLERDATLPSRTPREPTAWLRLESIERNNLRSIEAAFPLGVMTAVTGISGSGKSSLVSQALVDLVTAHLGSRPSETDPADALDLERPEATPTGGRIVGALPGIRRLVQVDQKPIGRTPRSNLATYTGLFDQVRKLFAATRMARARRYDAGQFSFNVAKGRCEQCAGEGFVMVELLFLPSVYAPCPVCHGARYHAKTLEVRYHDRNIAEVLAMTVDQAREFFSEDATLQRSLEVLHQVGVGYLRLGQPATELSGGEAQRIKLATELQRGGRGETLYVLDEPTTGLHPADVEKLVVQLDGLVDAGNTVIVVEHEMRIVAASDWVIDVGPGAGEAGGRIVASGVPQTVARARDSRTAPYLKRTLTPAAR